MTAIGFRPVAERISMQALNGMSGDHYDNYANGRAGLLFMRRHRCLWSSLRAAAGSRRRRT